MSAMAERAGGFPLWYGVSAGIVFWGVHVSGMAAITNYVCLTGQSVWYHALSVGTLVPTFVAFWPAWRHWRSDAGESYRFLGALAILMNLIFALAIIAEWVPVFVIDPCAH